MKGGETVKLLFLCVCTKRDLSASVKKTEGSSVKSEERNEDCAY